MMKIQLDLFGLSYPTMPFIVPEHYPYAVIVCSSSPYVIYILRTSAQR